MVAVRPFWGTAERPQDAEAFVILSIRPEAPVMRGQWCLLYGAGWEGPAVAGKLIFICGVEKDPFAPSGAEVIRVDQEVF